RCWRGAVPKRYQTWYPVRSSRSLANETNLRWDNNQFGSSQSGFVFLSDTPPSRRLIQVPLGVGRTPERASRRTRRFIPWRRRDLHRLLFPGEPFNTDRRPCSRAGCAGWPGRDSRGAGPGDSAMRACLAMTMVLASVIVLDARAGSEPGALANEAGAIL